MKYINTNDLNEPIDWNRKISSNKALTNKVKSIVVIKHRQVKVIYRLYTLIIDKRLFTAE